MSLYAFRQADLSAIANPPSLSVGNTTQSDFFRDLKAHEIMPVQFDQGAQSLLERDLDRRHAA